MKKKVVVLSGAGVSEESGISTFRDIKDGLWYNYNIDEVATIEAWEKNPQLVLDFHNMLRGKLIGVEPNDAHKALVELESKYDVSIITQNVDSLHEKAGSKNVIHIHGELFKKRPNNKTSQQPVDDENVVDCLGDLNIGDVTEDGVQYRPHTVLFGEYPFNIDKAHDEFFDTNIVIIVGTSIQFLYLIQMCLYADAKCKFYYVDPNPARILETYADVDITYVEEKAAKGIRELVDKLLAEEA